MKKFNKKVAYYLFLCIELKKRLIKYPLTNEITKNTPVIIRFWLKDTGIPKIGYNINCVTIEIIKPITTLAIDSSAECFFDCLDIF